MTRHLGRRGRDSLRCCTRQRVDAVARAGGGRRAGAARWARDPSKGSGDVRRVSAGWPALHWRCDLTVRSRPAEAFVGALDSSERQPLPGVDSSVRYVAPAATSAVRPRRCLVRTTVRPWPAPSVGRAVSDRAAARRWGVRRLDDRPPRLSRGTALQNSTLAWFDRTGKRLRTEALSGSIQAPTLSRDGKQVVVERTDPSGRTSGTSTSFAGPARA